MKKRVLALFVAAITVATMVMGCGGEETKEPEVTTIQDPVVDLSDEEDEAEPEVEEPEAEEEEEEEVREGYYRSELTNEWIDESLKNQRPIAAMVDNEKTALPHFGVNDCDIVYEMTNSTQNGGITRLMCIMKDWGSITQLGSIRSVRPTHLQIAPEYGAVVCHDGGPFWIDTFLKNAFVQHFSGTFSRVDNGKSREYTEYILSGDLDKNFKSQKLSTEYSEYYEGGAHFKFASEKHPVDLSEQSGTSCSEIKLPFKHNESMLTYDESKGLYLYSEYGSAHKDAKTGEQTGFKNVLLLSGELRELDEHGYMQFIVNSIKNREGYYATNGKVIPITWSKDNDISYTHYYDKDGNEITVNTGKTYIAIIPEKDYPNVSIN